jgi:lipoate-protein ligase A
MAAQTPVTAWRLLIDEPSSGAENMAVDEAILQARAEGHVEPTLRLYRWQPPTVSLGRFQGLDERIDVATIRERGYGLVRRPTGGRAILHSDELTYSVIVKQTDIEGGHALMSSYRRISQGIEAGLAFLGLEAGMGDGRDASRTTDKALPTICFAKAARCDLVSAGRKVVGSAQTRTRGCILQHGSIPLTIDLDELLAVFPGGTSEGGPERRERLARAAIGVAELLGRSVSFGELAAAIRAGFERCLEVRFREGVLAPEERACADSLVATKYGTKAWTEKAPRRSSTSAE